MRLAILLLGTTLFSSALAGPDSLSPGSPAPKLDIKTWYKGAPVKEFEADKTYVIEFWATWCGPCKTSIPHLTELARKNKDVTFIGVSVWEDDNGGIKKFVDDMGDKMDYTVAYSGNKEGMGKTWLEAAGQNGIPSSFIVKDRKVLWVGHPMAMDQPLAEIKAGTFDVAKFKANFELSAAKGRKEMAVFAAFEAADKRFKAGERKAAKADLAKIVKENPSMASSAEATRFDWLATEDPKAWDAKAQAMAKGKKPEEIQRLCGFAVKRTLTPEGYALGRRAIDLVLAAKPDDFNALQYGFHVYGITGDDKAKLDVTNRLLAGLPKSHAKDDEEYKQTLLKAKASLETKLASAKG